MKKRFVNIMKVLSVVTVIVLSGCGGGGGGGTDNNQPASHNLSGVAAAGAPVAGIVNVKGANGVEASATIDTNGAFDIDVSSLTAPYILYAEGTVNGRSVSMYSAAVVTGTINITPVTDFILRYALAGTDPAAAYSGWGTTQVTAGALTAAETLVQDQLAPVLASAGVSSTADLMTDPFAADHTGMDLVLDSTSITYSGTDVTVTNLMTGSTYSDNVASPTGTTGLPASDQAATTAAMTDGEAITAFWQAVTDLYATQPTQAQIASTFGPMIADDFVEDGQDKATVLVNWSTDIPSGITLTSSIEKAIIPAPAGYTSAYEILVLVTFGSRSMTMETNMVYDGTNWLWYGNRAWISYRLKPLAVMNVPAAGATSFTTGFGISMNDQTYDNPACTVKMYAYCKGVRSAIITGPGLPSSGLILTHTYPNNEFRIYNQTNNADVYVISDDAVIGAIPDNAVYTFNLYAETADVVSLSNTPLSSGTALNAKRPLLNSELTAALFPSLTSPSTHAVADAAIPGIQTVSWTAPAGIEVQQVYWNWTGGGSFSIARTDVDPGQTSATIDTSTYSAGPDAGTQTWLYLSARDVYDRDYRLSWQFQ